MLQALIGSTTDIWLNEVVQFNLIQKFFTDNTFIVIYSIHVQQWALIYWLNKNFHSKSNHSLLQAYMLKKSLLKTN